MYLCLNKVDNEEGGYMIFEDSYRHGEGSKGEAKECVQGAIWIS